MKKVLAFGALALLASCSSIMPVAATGNARGPVTGRSSSVTVCGLTINGDASIDAAAKSAGITHISTVDMQTRNVLGVYVRHTCIVNGQ